MMDVRSPTGEQAVRSGVRGVIRQPILHFLVLGAVLYAADRGLASRAQDGVGGAETTPIQISAEQVTELRRAWADRMRRPPRPEELVQQIQMAADEEMLFREALALGLNHRDPIVRRRLIRNMRLLTEDPNRKDDDLLREALALGMDRSDVVARRRLVQKIRFLASEAARTREPSTAELQQALARHAVRFLEPERVRLSHVYLGRDRRKEALESDARQLLANLRRDSIPPRQAHEHGDPFLLQHHLPPRSEQELAWSFGPRFAHEVMRVEPGAWSGPTASSYGLHLVWVHERTPRKPRSFESVRGEVRQALRAAREQEALDATLTKLRSRYGVRVENLPGQARVSNPPLGDVSVVR
jgi:hypothetical protein